jgi:hypothetical protein
MDGDRISGIITRSDVLKAIELREGVLSIARGGRTLEGKIFMTAETGMQFVLEQPTEKGFAWRTEYSGSEVGLVKQDTAKAPTGQDVQRFTFQAIREGVSLVRLQEVASPPDMTGSSKKRVLRTVTYTVTVGSPVQERI